MNVTGIIVTRCDVDLRRSLNNLGDAEQINEILVWRNGEALVRYEVRRPWEDGSFALILADDLLPVDDLAVYGRYAALEHASNEVVYVQDDDCIVAAGVVIAAYEPGRLVANMPRSRWDDYPDSTLVGWGAVFDRDLPDLAFSQFALSSHANGCIAWGAEGVDIAPFQRTCDVVFSALTPRTVIDVGFEHLPWAEDPARAMFKQPGHQQERDWMLDRCRTIRPGWDDDRRDL